MVFKEVIPVCSIDSGTGTRLMCTYRKLHVFQTLYLKKEGKEVREGGGRVEEEKQGREGERWREGLIDRFMVSFYCS